MNDLWNLNLEATTHLFDQIILSHDKEMLHFVSSMQWKFHFGDSQIFKY